LNCSLAELTTENSSHAANDYQSANVRRRIALELRENCYYVKFGIGMPTLGRQLTVPKGMDVFCN